MFNKILIAEDFGSTHIAVKKAMQELEITVADQVYYCDEALLKIRKSFKENKPYELLVTDLSFDSDTIQQITGGTELISQVKREFPSVKIIVFSVENRSFKIQELFEKYNIEGFICKGRDDIKELKKAIQEVYEGAKVSYGENNVFNLSENDMKILELLSGRSVEEVSKEMKKRKISPNSTSHINKRLMFMRKAFDAENTLNLLAKLADLGFI